MTENQAYRLKPLFHDQKSPERWLSGFKQKTEQ